MEVRIAFRSLEPPEGRTWRDGHRDWLPFVGWLELISAIERLLEAGRRPLPELMDREGVVPSEPEQSV